MRLEKSLDALDIDRSGDIDESVLLNLLVVAGGAALDCGDLTIDRDTIGCNRNVSMSI